jgi:DNA topoisomerase-3
MSMAESLAIVQKLYEEGFLTYPRTNSEYMATAEKGKVRKILENCAKLGYPVVFKDKKSIFDDSKIESHSAITPTYKIPDKSRLSEKEMQVYSTVFRRFVAVFCAEDCVVEKVEMTVSVGELEDFILKGLTIKEKGWTKYDDCSQRDKILPDLKKGDVVCIDFKPLEKETTPPKHYTIETLNNYLKNPFREEKAAIDDTMGADDAEEYRAMLEGVELGTEATRTGIIDNARKSGYIQLKKDVYTILPDGIYMIEALSRLNINMDKFKTSEMGKALKRVYKNEIAVGDSVELAKNEIKQYFEAKEIAVEDDTDTGFFGDVIGVCPLCSNEVRRGKFGYGCMGYKAGCKFNVSSYICGRSISVSNVKLLLETGKSSKIRGFVSKQGKSFDAYLKLSEGKCVFDFDDAMQN